MRWKPKHNDMMRFLQIIATIFGLIASSGATLELTSKQSAWCGLVATAALTIYGLYNEQAMKEALRTPPPMPPLQVPPWVQKPSRAPHAED